MNEQQLAITITHGQTFYAVPMPEDQRDLAELVGDSGTIELAASGDDVEGHALTGNDVVVDVEGHALTLHVPNAADAAALRRALAVGVVTATLVGAGAIASLQTPAHAPSNVQPPAQVLNRGVPAQAIHADAAAAQTELLYGQAATTTQAQVTRVPVQAIHADQAADAHAANETGATRVPPQAIHADQAERQREQQ